MLSGLQFETAAPSDAASPDRTDIACFVGHVALRPGASLAAGTREAARAAGWLDGRPEAADTIEHLPVVVESFDEFARFFVWERRPIAAGGEATCATYLGTAVRSFFATGGRRAVVVRVADPFPFLEAPGGRDANRGARLQNLVPAYSEAGLPARPFDAGNPGGWRGIEHLEGLPEVSHVCLPDLPDICAVDPLAPPTAFAPPPAPEVFVECSEAERPPADEGLRRQAAPLCDAQGFDAWRRVVRSVSDFLARRRRDVLLVAALPLALPDARHGAGLDVVHAQSNLLGFLRSVGVLEPADRSDATAGTAATAFAQFTWPWLRTVRSGDLPQSLEPADGLLAGLLARNALVRGTFRSVGGTALDDVVGLVPLPAMGLGRAGPTPRLAERLCVIGPEPEGNTLLSDVTSSADVAWRPGGTSRLLAAILRTARRFGESHAFDANGPALWTRLTRSFEAMLAGFWREGAFGGANMREAFEVRCDRGTMTQNDLDSGRLVAEITVLPSAAITRITVVLAMTLGETARTEVREVA